MERQELVTVQTAGVRQFNLAYATFGSEWKRKSELCTEDSVGHKEDADDGFG